MGTDELTNAIRALATRAATDVALAAYDLACLLLPIAAEYRTPIDVAALRILSLALYRTATHKSSSRDVPALFAYVDVSLDQAFDELLRDSRTYQNRSINSCVRLRICPIC